MNNLPAELRVTVVMPIYNEAIHIERSLRSILEQDYPSGLMEILIVDGISIDGTRELVTQMMPQYPRIVMRLLDNPKHIVPAAMNIGIRAAHGDLIIRMDGHSEYPANYVRTCAETSRRTGAENVGGLFISQLWDNTLSARLIQALTTHPFGVGNADYRLNAADGLADTVPYGCFLRNVFEQFGLYDERLVRNQDYEMNARIRRKGGLIWRNSAIKIFYYNQSTFVGLLKQAALTGCWNPWMWYIAPYSFSLRHAVPSAFVLTLLFSLLILAVPSWGSSLLLLIMILYLIPSFFSAGQQAKRYGWWMLPLLPFMFFVYHLAYGIGTMWGIFMLLTKRAPVQLASEPWPDVESDQV